MEPYRDGFTWSPPTMRGHIHKYTGRAPKFMISGSPAHIWCMLVGKHEGVIYGTIQGWFHMVTPTMRGHTHRYTGRALKFKISGSPAHI